MSQAQQLELTCGKYRVVVADASWGADPAGYAISHHLEGEMYRASSWHRVTVLDGEEAIRVCLLLGGGGASGIHDHSGVCVGDKCYVAVGDSICALFVPSLDLIWHTRADSATCFGVYYLPEFNCLISHGELEITRLDLEGRIVWQTSGRDIFSDGVAFQGCLVEATDFNKTTYCIAIETGQIVADFPTVQGA